MPTTSATRGNDEAGERTSSTNFGMSSGGRLSMTNHPRSSRSSAACDRPAPDKPVMMTNSVMPSGGYWGASDGRPSLGRTAAAAARMVMAAAALVTAHHVSDQ